MAGQNRLDDTQWTTVVWLFKHVITLAQENNGRTNQQSISVVPESTISVDILDDETTTYGGLRCQREVHNEDR
jgi:hypothetical protein